MTDASQSKLPKAIALSYDAKVNQAPRVVAKGTGFLAEQILTAARQHGVPVYQNNAISAMLFAVELDSEIPPELYQAVAEVLAYIYRLDNQLGSQRK